MPTSTRKLKLPIPVNIVTGSPGSGKSTLIASLVALKPALEHWALVVNDFGAPSEGGHAFPEDGVTVQRLGGGCMCCTLAGAMTAGVAQLVRRVRPHRLVIETSGAGHPAALLDALRDPHLATALRVNAVIVVVDASQGCAPEWRDNQVAQDQVSAADIVVLSKGDLASEGDRAAARQFAAQLFPPKIDVVAAWEGGVAIELLDVPREAALALPARPFEDDPSWADPESDARPAEGGRSTSSQAVGVLAAPRQPAQYPVERCAPYAACGWLFHPDDVFYGVLLRAMMQLCCCWAKVRGVFRVGREYVKVLGGPGSDFVVVSIAYRRESRVELVNDVCVADSVESGPIDRGEHGKLQLGDGGALLNDALQHVGGVDAVAFAVRKGDWNCVEAAFRAILKT